jgi:hypothetical protein
MQQPVSPRGFEEEFGDDIDEKFVTSAAALKNMMVEELLQFEEQQRLDDLKTPKSIIRYHKKPASS